jgi:hypothetical protein
MKPCRNIKREVVAGLGLFAALAAGGLLVNRHSRGADTPAPAPEPVQTAQGSSAAQPVKGVSHDHAALQPAEPVQDQIKTMKPVAEESGYEMPFADTNQVPVNTTATQTDPEKLRAALADAVAAGNVREIAVLLHSGNPATEIEAVRLLARTGGGDALAAALGKVLSVPADSPDYDKFINAFADCRSAAVAEWLTGFLGQTKTEDVRQRVLTLLAALNGPEVINSLAASLASPIDSMHAKDCAELLAQASDPEQAAVLRNLLEMGKTTEIQTSAARGLARVGSGAACAALVETGSSTDDIAAACRDALATVNSSYGQEALIQAAVSPDVPSAVRCAAVQALSNQQGQRIQTVLANLGQATGDPVLQTTIEQALQTAGSSGTPPSSGSPAGIAGIDGEIWF